MEDYNILIGEGMRINQKKIKKINYFFNKIQRGHEWDKKMKEGCKIIQKNAVSEKKEYKGIAGGEESKVFCW